VPQFFILNALKDNEHERRFAVAIPIDLKGAGRMNTVSEL
jgi:hypothetical protein